MKPHRLAAVARIAGPVVSSASNDTEHKPDKGSAALDVSAIYGACWWVRHYRRGGRVAALRIYRTQAIQKLGLICREAFNRADDFEPVLTALVDRLQQHNEPPF